MPGDVYEADERDIRTITMLGWATTEAVTTDDSKAKAGRTYKRRDLKAEE